ncbi:MAG: LysM peptidoglycan-binding domain-containing protein [Sphingobacteriales bacterium]|jgi:LysM repeat protein|nr:LysM peptidoglycan-binding domain-containing protein [Sphingobacteriales bacterium]MBP9140663.1 LysM peptidoglycan-binding domain-containing protein [Chitinophagales bacterium]MBK7528403.1 LysM peptidoglycan-binding domain-containing protein [Sphingobacteriales bacterium]MBK8680135.1 LysM peptidoglycan-binding domain-containing protein [Sphingobacteriales bacterium]MBL0248177.1 LysM peptidoglycan-binding domain-containing protein [Sphingobacteriales bacterium]
MTYTVQAGDTLYKIAIKFSCTIDALKKANNLLTDALALGQILKIPGSNSNGGNPSNYTIYIVKPGDTLYKIATEHKTSVETIKSLNNLLTNTLSVGQQLKLPGGGNNSSGNQGGNNNTGGGADAPKTTIYTVKQGDTLFKIAQLFNITVDVLRSLNNLTSNALTIGQQLKVPISGTGSSSGSSSSGTSGNNTNNNSGGNSNSNNTGNNTNSPPDTTTTPIGNFSFKFAYQLKGSVGLDGDNYADDVRRVQQSLNAAAFLSTAHLDLETPTETGQAIISAQRLQHTIAAIKQFCKLSEHLPDPLVEPQSQLLMLLQTAILFPAANDRAAILTARNTIGLTTTNAAQFLEAGITAPVGNSATGNRSADVVKIQKALVHWQFLSEWHGETPIETVVSAAQLPKTINAINEFQAKYVKKWLAFTNIVKNNVYSNGIIAPNDLSFQVLRDFAKYALSFVTPNGTSKKIAFNNYVRSSATQYLSGISYEGEATVSMSSASSEAAQFGITPFEIKVLKAISANEGNFDAINSYDKAVFSYGFIQFAGGGRGLPLLMAAFKYFYPDAFQQCFQQYGIDCEYNINEFGIDESRICVYDAESHRLLRDPESEVLLRDNKQLTGVFIKAAYDPKMQLTQLKVAKNNYIIPALSIKLKFDVPVVKALAADKKTVTAVHVGANSFSFKNTSEFNSLLSAGRIHEYLVSFANVPITQIIRSELGLTVLCDITVNRWIVSAAKIFIDAIKKVAAADKLDSVEKIKQINEAKIVEAIISFGISPASDRAQAIRAVGNLSTAK